ncbi:hypothetical protein ACUH78_06610 [Thauera sp. ZXT1-4]
MMRARAHLGLLLAALAASLRQRSGGGQRHTEAVSPSLAAGRP